MELNPYSQSVCEGMNLCDFMGCSKVAVKRESPNSFEALLPLYMGIAAERTAIYSAPAGTRTPNLLIRSQALCPIELRGH
jgi:hypothetical protein